MNTNKIILLFLLFSCTLWLCGCNKNDSVDPVEENPEKEIVYEAVPIPPTISDIDESGYTTYYVDSGPLGNDENNGLSEQTPFRSLKKITTLVKTSKMRVLFKSGATFIGNLILEDLKGEEDKPFIVDKYGGDDRPIIDGNGVTSAVEIKDGNIRFRNIKVTNKTGSRGIYVTPVKSGAMKNIEISGCRVEDVNWKGNDEIIDINPSKLDVEKICPNEKFIYQHGGILFDANTPPATGASWFENIFITKNEIFKVSRTGIWLDSQWAKRPGISWGYNDYVDDNNGWFPAKNVIVQGNDISYVGGDGTVLIATRNSFLDHNKVYHANYLGRTGYFNAGLWPHSSINCVMQFNEVGYTHLENGGGDGEGLDVDVANVNCLVQFNYVHHNDGGGILLCNDKGTINGKEQIGNHQGTIIRNNVFYDNGKSPDNPAFCVITSAVGRTELYNNTVIVTNRRPDVLFLLSADWANIGKSKDISFKNNIFMATDPVAAQFNTKEIINSKFENNLVFQIGEKIPDKQLLNFNPQIQVPPVIGGYENGLKFIPKALDVFEKGILFDGMPEKDMAGNATNKIKYLGAFCK